VIIQAGRTIHRRFSALKFRWVRCFSAVRDQRGMGVTQLAVIAPDSYRGHRIELR